MGTRNRYGYVIHTKDNKHSQFNDSEEQIWKGPFFFIQGADSQFGLYDRENNLPAKGWEVEKRLSTICVNKINAMSPKPKFFVICGDLCDEFPNLENSVNDPERKIEQEKTFFSIFGKLNPDIPLVCVCGNHDVGDQPTVTSIERYRTIHGNDFFSFWAGGVLFLVLNTQYYQDGTLINDLVKEQDVWLEEQLKLSSTSKHGAVIFQHIPWFLKNPDETDSGYFAISLESRTPLLEKLYNAGVRYVFCGHYHRNSHGYYKDMEMIVTSAIGMTLGDDKSGFRVVNVNENKILHNFYSFEEIENKDFMTS